METQKKNKLISNDQNMAYNLNNNHEINYEEKY